MCCKIIIMKKVLFILVLLISFAGLYAQSADVVTQIINAPKATYGQVCYLSAVHQKLVTEKSSLKNAVEVLYKEGQIPSLYDENEAAKLEDIAAIYMKMWPEEKAGLMYRITKGSKRYAYKYLKDMGMIQYSCDADQAVSGREALNILTACMAEIAPEAENMNMEIGE